VAVTKINEFMQKIGVKGGMSLTTGFDVEFDFDSNPDCKFRSTYYEKDVVHMLCDEAQLPNVQSAVGQVNGRYLGEGSVSYPHTRIFTDLGMGFLCDAQLTPLKFFNEWYEYIYESVEGVYSNSYDGLRSSTSGMTPKGMNRSNRLRYMGDYTCTLKIVKTEPNKDAANGRAPITYLLENAYPYSIDSVPLQYGASQLTRVNVNFYYSRHQIRYGFVNNQTATDSDEPGFGNFGTTRVNGVQRGQN